MSLTTESTYRIIVAVDFAETSAWAVQEAMRLAARADNTELHFLHVINDPHPERADHLARDERALRKAHEDLNNVVRSHREVDAAGREQNVFLHAQVGDPGRAIQQLAVDLNADLIVVGSHGRRGLERLLLGSVSSSLILEGRTPVLVVRPKNYAGKERTPQVDPPDPARPASAPSLTTSERTFVGRRSLHVSGLL